MTAQFSTSSSAPSPPIAAHVGQPDAALLTHVSLAYIEQQFKLYLRFGEPARMYRIDRWRRCAVFLPSSIFCRIRWQANAYGTVRWQLMVMQAGTPLDAVQRIPGVSPGARLLLYAEGERQVRAVLERIDAIEAQGTVPAAVSPEYWRMLANRLAARLPLPEYTGQRHAAWLARKDLS